MDGKSGAQIVDLRGQVSEKYKTVSSPFLSMLRLQSRKNGVARIMNHAELVSVTLNPT